MRPFEYLFLRNIRFDYICPPICEALFSSTGEPTILLEVFDTSPVVGLEYEWDGSNFTIKWSAYPGALCYSVYRVENGTYVLVAECVSEIVVPDDGVCYAVTAITPEGETPPSGIICPTQATCPVWDSTPPAAQSVACGYPVSLTAEAHSVNPPGALITYTWTLNDEVIFQETKTGASTYTNPAADEDADGVYVVAADNGVCELQSEAVVTVAGCGGGGCSCTGVMPDSFMFDDPLLIGTFTGQMDINSTWHSAGTIPAGRYVWRYNSGHAKGCVHNYLGCLANTSYSYNGILGKVRVDNQGLGSFTDEANFTGVLIQAAEGGATCVNQPSDEDTDALLDAVWIGREIEFTDLVPVVWSYPDHDVEYNISAVWGDPVNQCDETCDVEISLHRLQSFYDQPQDLTIASFEAIKDSLLPVDAVGADLPDQWDGTIEDTAGEQPNVSDLSVSYAFYTVVPAIRNVDVALTTLTGSAGNQWRLSIYGYYTTDGVNYTTALLWEGDKTVGLTGAGQYCRTSSLNAGAPSCITLV